MGLGRKTFFPDRPPSWGSAGGLYVHVPFCQARCRYCDFCSSPYTDPQAAEMVPAILAELARRSEAVEHPLRTAFIGGGTPTVLEEPLLRSLAGGVGRLAGPQTEFTCEANPNSLTPAVLAALLDASVNRLSLGVQSFIPGELTTLGRLHTPDQVAEAVVAARTAGFTNISLDLIYGIPGQTRETWLQSLQAAIACGVEHVSCYCLSFEPGTPLAEDLAARRVAAMDEDLQRECYYLAIDELGHAGLAQYEISNFARPDRQCRHNLIYWHNEPYLGVGPSAVSYIEGQRQSNTADLATYVRRIATGGLASASTESLAGRELMAETLMLTLRLREGADRQAFVAQFGEDPVEAFKTPILRYLDMGMLELTSAHLRLARQALFVADTILADILAWA